MYIIPLNKSSNSCKPYVWTKVPLFTNLATQGIKDQYNTGVS